MVGIKSLILLTPVVAPRMTHVQPRHQQKAADQTEMLEKLVFRHEAAGRREFPESVCMASRIVAKQTG